MINLKNPNLFLAGAAKIPLHPTARATRRPASVLPGTAANPAAALGLSKLLKISEPARADRPAMGCDDRLDLRTLVKPAIPLLITVIANRNSESIMAGIHDIVSTSNAFIERFIAFLGCIR
jgi:hypothetical protein